MRSLGLLVHLPLLAGLCCGASAAPLYTASYSHTPVFGASDNLSSDTPGITTEGTFFQQSTVFPNRITQGSWFARANQGSLQASINADRSFTAGSNFDLGAGASLFYDDLIFASAVHDFIDVVLPLHLGGSLTASLVSTRVSVEARLAGQRRTGAFRPALDEASGLLSGLSGGVVDATLMAHYAGVPTNTPVSILLDLGTDIQINGDNTAFSNFASTFGFVTDGPTFIVPDGVNVNSEQAGIVDNRFGAVAVGEPVSLVLVGLGVAVLAARRARRRSGWTSERENFPRNAEPRSSG